MPAPAPKLLNLVRDGDVVLLFAYGDYSKPEVVHAITGSDPVDGVEAVLENWQVCRQRISQTSGQARAVLLDAWDGKDREHYTCIRRMGAKTEGTLWSLTTKQAAMLAEFDLVEEGLFESKRLQVRVAENHLYLSTVHVAGPEQIQVTPECSLPLGLLRGIDEYRKVGARFQRHFGARSQDLLNL